MQPTTTEHLNNLKLAFIGLEGISFREDLADVKVEHLGMGYAAYTVEAMPEQHNSLATSYKFGYRLLSNGNVEPFFTDYVHVLKAHAHEFAKLLQPDIDEFTVLHRQYGEFRYSSGNYLQREMVLAIDTLIYPMTVRVGWFRDSKGTNHYRLRGVNFNQSSPRASDYDNAQLEMQRLGYYFKRISINSYAMHVPNKQPHPISNKMYDILMAMHLGLSPEIIHRYMEYIYARIEE